MEEIDNIAQHNQEIVNELLGEYKEQRSSLKIMVTDLEKLKKDIDKLFPEKLDKRYQRFFEEKVKTATSLFNAILDIRKELSRILKDEIDLRRKAIKGEDDFVIEDLLDVRKIAKQVEAIKKSTNRENKIEEKTEEKVNDRKHNN